MELPDLTSADLRDLLDREAARINSPAFIADDPVQFPRRFSSVPDIEIAGLLSATIAWGNRRMICNNCNRLLSLMDNCPYDYLMDEGYEDLPPEQNIHRTFFGRNFRHLMRGLRRIYARHGSLDAFSAACGAPAAETPAWHLAAALNAQLSEANGGVSDSRCLPLNLGIWKSLRPSQLYLPLDVHAGNTARALGLLKRRANDRRAVMDLTDAVRPMRPGDPAFYDFALFGIGIESRLKA